MTDSFNLTPSMRFLKTQQAEPSYKIRPPTYLIQNAQPTYHPKPSIGLSVWWKPANDRIIANRALHHYNKTNGTNFVLVADNDTLRSHSFSGKWIHICFNAEEDSSIKLFFAEIKYSWVSMPAVTICQILDGETKHGCENCESSEVIHPVEGYHRREFLDNMQIVEEEKDSCNKVYEEEYLGHIG